MSIEKLQWREEHCTLWFLGSSDGEDERVF